MIGSPAGRGCTRAQLTRSHISHLQPLDRRTGSLQEYESLTPAASRLHCRHPRISPGGPQPHPSHTPASPHTALHFILKPFPAVTAKIIY